MEAESLLREITDYCRRTGVAESTFGRHAVNDGKFVNRLREGGRITTTTFERVRSFIGAEAAAGKGSSGALVPGGRPGRRSTRASAALARQTAPATVPSDRNFRFFDNRQKYLMFVNTCSEKAVVAQTSAAPAHPVLFESIAALARQASIETSAKNLVEIDAYPAMVPAGTDVYVAWVPGFPYHHIASVAKRLRQTGLNCVLTGSIGHRWPAFLSVRQLRSIGALDQQNRGRAIPVCRCGRKLQHRGRRLRQSPSIGRNSWRNAALDRRCKPTAPERLSAVSG